MIVTFTGSNSFALNESIKKLKADFISKHGDLALEKIDGEEAEFERITDAMQALPFLAAKRLVILRSPSSHKEFVEHFEKLIERVPDETTLIIFEPKLDKRSSYFKTLKKKTEFKELNELDNFELQKWLVNRAKNFGATITQSNANYLINRIGPNQQLLANEIDKLINYEPEVSRKNIDLLTESTPQSTVFELLDAALSGKTKRAIEIYDEQRLQKVEPQVIIGLLAWQLHILALVKSAPDKSAEEIASEAKLNPFVVRKSLSLAKNLDMKEVKKLISEALELDIRLKSESIDADEALKNFFLTLKN